MTNLGNPFLPAIEALEQDYSDLERKAISLLESINLLREKAGMPPRPNGGLASPIHGAISVGPGGLVKLHSDSFTGKRLGSAVREYLEMRKASGADAPATTREIFDALKEGGFSSGAKDDATGMVVLRTMLRKNTAMFAKLNQGKYGMRSWYPHLKAPKEAASDENEDSEEDAAATVEVAPKGTAPHRKPAAS